MNRKGLVDRLVAGGGLVLVLGLGVLALGGPDALADPAPDTTPAVTTAPDVTAAPTTAAPTTVAPAPPTTVAPAPPSVPEAPTTPVAPPVPTAGREQAVPVEGAPTMRISLRANPSTVRVGRPVTLVARVTNPVDGFSLPESVDFFGGGEIFIGTAPLNRNLVARFVWTDPFSTSVGAMIFQSPWMEFPIFDSTPVSVISGFGAEVSFSTTPAQPVAGGFAVVNATVTSTGPLPPQKSGRATEGAPPTPTGEVQVLAGQQNLGSSQLSNGRATIPIVVPTNGAPISVSYSGDDVTWEAASRVSVTPVPPPPPTSTPPPATAVPVAETTGPTEAVVVTTAVPPPTTVVEEEVGDEDEEVVDDDVAEDDGEEVAAAPADDSGRTQAERSTFVRTIPTPSSVSWSLGHVAVNSMLALLLLLLVGIPATLVDNTLEENYDRIFGAHPKVRHVLLRAEAAFSGVPTWGLLGGLSVVAALIFGQLEFDLGFNLTSFLLLLAMALVVAIIVGVHDVARLPYLRRVAGDDAAARLGVYPFALILAITLVVISKVAGFQPGFVFGVLGGLALSEAVRDEDDGKTLAWASIALMAIGAVAWLAWTPIADEAVQPDPGNRIIFLDAFLATLWLSCLQAVVFGLAPLKFLDGDLIRSWSKKAWLGLWVLSMFLLVQVYLHPSAGRWGGVDSNTMRSALSVFGVFFLVGVAFWAWFRFRPAPDRDPRPEAEPSEIA